MRYPSVQNMYIIKDPDCYMQNWKLKKFSWAETMVSFAGFDEFAGFVFLRTICWFRRNRARFGNAEFYAAMAFHETLLKSRVSSPKPWFRCLDNNFLWNYVHYDLNLKLAMYMDACKERH